ncbi:MAG: transcriptional regulator, partial [Armatimonadetes bacterium]|nr:transcriptional regulator [Armatimonadota bacterium]
DYAYHGVHAFYMWYWGILGRVYAGKVIFVKGNKKVAERLGVETAPTIREAIEMAKSFLGKSDPSISYFHLPPIFTCRVD